MKKIFILYLTIFFGLTIFPGCNSGQDKNSADVTLISCDTKIYETLKDLTNDNECKQTIDKKIAIECYKDQYNNRQDFIQQQSRVSCQEALDVKRKFQEQEARLRGFTTEEFLQSKLSNNISLNGNYITHFSALEIVKNSNTLKPIISDFPNFFDNVEIYSTREVKKLAESKLLFPINSSIQEFDDANINENVWQILITCKQPSCDHEKYLATINTYIKANNEVGLEDSADDLIFVLNAKDGKIIMFERGPGIRDNNLNFNMQWLRIN